MNTKGFGVTTDYDYAYDHKRDRIEVWSGQWYHTFEAEGFSLPNDDGYMLTTYNGDKIRVSCPVPRNEHTYEAIDAAVSRALNEFYGIPA